MKSKTIFKHAALLLDFLQSSLGELWRACVFNTRTSKTKGFARSLLLLLCIAGFTACGNLPEGASSDANFTAPETGNNAAVETEAIVLNEDGGGLMFYTLNGINSSLVTVNTRSSALTASDGTAITADSFRTGQLAKISYDGMIADSYPGQIFTCYGIRITGEADAGETADALEKYRAVHTIEGAVYYVNPSGTLAIETVSVTYGNYFGEWKKLNGVPENVTLLKMSSEDNAYDETNGEAVTHYPATIRDFHLDLSAEFSSFLSSVTDERITVASLVKTIIGDNPAASDTAVFLTVNGSPLKTASNDFSGRLSFEM